MRRFTLALAGLLACCASASGAPQAAGGSNAIASGSTAVATASTAIATASRSLQAVAQAKTIEAQRTAAIEWLSGQVYAYQQATWHWENLMGTPRTPTEGRVLHEMSVPDVKRAVVLWEHRATVERKRAARPPHLAQFLCIHHYEGSWTDGGGPYYGGLQMDLGFQRTYAPQLLRTKGTADHWTPLEQIWTAEKAARSRGFWPWPNTARFCGLI